MTSSPSSSSTLSWASSPYSSSPPSYTSPYVALSPPRLTLEGTSSRFLTTVLLDWRIRCDGLARACIDRWLGSELGSPKKVHNGCYVFAQPYTGEITTIASCSV